MFVNNIILKINLKYDFKYFTSHYELYHSRQQCSYYYNNIIFLNNIIYIQV